MKRERLNFLFAHVVFVAIFLGLLEWAMRIGWLNPVFLGSPSGVAKFLWNAVQGFQLWRDLAWTLMGTLASFALGSAAAIAVGLLFVAKPRVERFLDPYLGAVNMMPRIALAPLFMLWFGIGLGSKVAVGFSLTFFIVLSSTMAGMRGVSMDHVTLCRSLGASPTRTFFQVTLPGAVPVIFSGLRLGLIYALLGVIGAEIIASERGLGQYLTYLSSTFNVDGVLAVLLILALLGVLVVRAMNYLEQRLLHWQ